MRDVPFVRLAAKNLVQLENAPAVSEITVSDDVFIYNHFTLYRIMSYNKDKMIGG